VQDVRRSFAVVGVEGALLALPARAVARVTLLEDGGDFGAGLRQFSVGDCAGVVDDLMDCQCCELSGHQLRCLLQPRRTSNREHKRTHEFLAQDAGRVLDLFADHVEVLADVVRPLVRSLIKEDAFDVNAVAGGLVVFRPAAVDGHIVEDLLDRSFAVLHPYVAHGRHILLRVE
jgi:hypothetical protein